MASLIDSIIQVNITDTESFGTVGFKSRRRWNPGSGTNAKRETVSLTGSAFTALSVPSGSKAILIDPGAAVSLVLKGVTGDGGINITPASAPLNIPVFLPLGASPNIGILNNGTTVVIEVLWL